jgi:hypothetical protein
VELLALVKAAAKQALENPSQCQLSPDAEKVFGWQDRRNSGFTESK